MKVYIAIIDVGYGCDLSIFANPISAKKAVYNFVADWWYHDGMSDECPDDMDEAIERYFDTIDRSYDLLERKVQGPWCIEGS